MENISMPVSPFITRSFENAEASVKRKAEIYINAWLNNFLSNMLLNEQLFDILKKATKEAGSKGFTPEKLDELLKDQLQILDI